MTTSGASREAKPDRPKVKPTSDNFTSSGLGYIIICWIPLPCICSDVNATSVGSNDNINDNHLHISVGDQFSDTTEGYKIVVKLGLGLLCDFLHILVVIGADSKTLLWRSCRSCRSCPSLQWPTLRRVDSPWPTALHLSLARIAALSARWSLRRVRRRKRKRNRSFLEPR